MTATFSPKRWQGYDIRELTIANVLARQARLYGSKTYLHDLETDRRYGYAEVDAITNRLANGFIAHGISKGSHVAVMLPNGPSCLFTFYALGKIGAVAVPIHAGSRGALLAYLLNTADVSGVVAESEGASRVLDIVADVEKFRLLVTVDALPAHATVPPQVTAIRHDALDQGDERRPDVEVAFNDMAYIMFTSGTTGPSKGNMIVQAACFMWDHTVPEMCGATDQDTYYCPVSMSHVAGLFSIGYLMLALGGTIALRTKFSATAFLDDVRRSSATLAQLLGAMFDFVERQPPSPTDADNRLRIILGGPLPADAVGFSKRFGIELCQGYGLSDHSTFTKFRPGSRPDKLGSIGQAIEPFDVRIVDENDFEMPPGSPGEIVVRAREPWRSSSGYYKNAAASFAARRNDWFHTGDRGVMDEEGYFWFLNRIKDSIRRRGENISAYEVEQVLLRFPAILEAAAYAVPAESSEDEVAVTLIPRDGMTINVKELAAHCATGMAPFMVPRFYHVAKSLPRTVTERVEKYKLRQLYIDQPNQFWDRAAVSIAP